MQPVLTQNPAITVNTYMKIFNCSAPTAIKLRKLDLEHVRKVLKQYAPTIRLSHFIKIHDFVPFGFLKYVKE